MKDTTEKKVLIVGGVAYDHIMTYDKPFNNALSMNPGEHLSVSFTAATKRFNFGGCGGNIAYTLKLLEIDGYIFSSAGRDFDEYKKWLEFNGIDTSGLRIDENVFCASCYILTDVGQSQITMFYPGAQGSFINDLNIHDLNLSEFGFAIVAPDHPKRMPILGRQLMEGGIPYLFDPSQQIASIEAKELYELTKGARLLIVNQYEAGVISERIGISREELMDLVPSYVETHGEKGCLIREGGVTEHVSAIIPKQALDPTGCGDAFRSGVLMGLIRGYDLKKSCKIGALAATYNIEYYGTQNHKFGLQEFEKRYEESFGEKL